MGCDVNFYILKRKPKFEKIENIEKLSEFLPTEYKECFLKIINEFKCSLDELLSEEGHGDGDGFFEQNDFKNKYGFYWSNWSKNGRCNDYELNKSLTHVIMKTFYRDDDDRSFLMAEIVRTDGKIQILPASVLELESK